MEHAAGDLIAVVRAGTPIDELQPSWPRPVSSSRSMTPLPGATVGGTVAVNASGPRRMLYGTARDLLIGVTVVRPDGVVAHAGGKVVKNVAGYDLGKLLTGSYGTLGLITECAFRLHPVPAARAWFRGGCPDAGGAGRLVAAVLARAGGAERGRGGRAGGRRRRGGRAGRGHPRRGPRPGRRRRGGCSATLPPEGRAALVGRAPVGCGRHRAQADRAAVAVPDLLAAGAGRGRRHGSGGVRGSAGSRCALRRAAVRRRRAGGVAAVVDDLRAAARAARRARRRADRARRRSGTGSTCGARSRGWR